MRDVILCGDNVQILQEFESNCIDLTVTSPPYDNLRTYNGYTWDFEAVARELYRVTKPGGVVVWVVGDATVDGSETGTSFRQALYFMECGFNLHDTMIYQTHKPPMNDRRYQNSFEYMFVFSKDIVKTFNPIYVKSYLGGSSRSGDTYRQPDGSVKSAFHRKPVGEKKIKSNVWFIDAGYMKTTDDGYAYSGNNILDTTS